MNLYHKIHDHKHPFYNETARNENDFLDKNLESKIGCFGRID